MNRAFSARCGFGHQPRALPWADMKDAFGVAKHGRGGVGAKGHRSDAYLKLSKYYYLHIIYNVVYSSDEERLGGGGRADVRPGRRGRPQNAER
jgi:hypothetical protein